MTPDVFAMTTLHVIAGRSSNGLPFINRAASILPIVAARDPLAYDLRPHSVPQTGWRILNLLTSVAAETSELAETVDETLQKRWAPRIAKVSDQGQEKEQSAQNIFSLGNPDHGLHAQRMDGK